jgi:type VI secretion system secreted protein Hcp
MAVDIFLSIGDIKGESLDSKHKAEIDVLSWAWGMRQSGTMHLGTGGGGGKVAIDNLCVMKYTDKATPVLIDACAKGTHFPKAVLTVRKAGGAVPLEYYVITLENVLVSAHAANGAETEDRFTETVSLNFQCFHVQYQPQSETGGKKGGVVESKWNIVANSDT